MPDPGPSTLGDDRESGGDDAGEVPPRHEDAPADAEDAPPAEEHVPQSEGAEPMEGEAEGPGAAGSGPTASTDGAGTDDAADAPGDAAGRSEQAASDEASGSDSETADVLLVEDNPGDVRLTEEAFEAGPVDKDLHVVTDGNEALEFLNGRGVHADAPRPDLVLLDLNLPRKNGDEVLEAVADDPDLATIPVVVLTSSNAQEDVERSYSLRANAFLTKPVDPEEFIEVVRSVQEFWLSVVRLPPAGDDD